MRDISGYTTLCCVRSVVMSCFVFIQKLQLPAAQQQQYQPNSRGLWNMSKLLNKISRLSRCHNVYFLSNSTQKLNFQRNEVNSQQIIGRVTLCHCLFGHSCVVVLGRRRRPLRNPETFSQKDGDRVEEVRPHSA